MKQEPTEGRTWVLYETTCGGQWASMHEREQDGQPCTMSRCPQSPNLARLRGHRSKLCLTRKAGETMSREEAHNWFRYPQYYPRWWKRTA